MPAPQYRYWSATSYRLNSFPLQELPNELSWCAGQEEKCPTTGRVHWQLAFHAKKKMSLAACKRIFPNDHLEPSRSEAADEYVAKIATAQPGTYFQLGNRPVKQNNKIDWARQLDLAKRGLEEQMDPGVYIRCYNTIKKIKAENLVAPPDALDVTGLWIWGPPGVGKSRKVRADNPEIYDKPANKWWDGYKTGPALIDDFDLVHKVLGHHLKRWADRYSFTAEIKGGTVSIRPTQIIITSNYSIQEIFGDDQTLVAALTRRFNIINMV